MCNARGMLCAQGQARGQTFTVLATQDVVWERLDSVHNDTTFLRSDLTPFQAPAERDLADRAAVAASLAQAAFASVVPQRHGALPMPSICPQGLGVAQHCWA